MSITESELIEQVEWALYNSADPQGAMSVTELSEALSMGPQAVRVRLKRMIKSGQVEVVQVPRTNIVGVVQKQFCYKMVEPRGE